MTKSKYRIKKVASNRSKSGFWFRAQRRYFWLFWETLDYEATYEEALQHIKDDSSFEERKKNSGITYIDTRNFVDKYIK